MLQGYHYLLASSVYAKKMAIIAIFNTHSIIDNNHMIDWDKAFMEKIVNV